MNDSDYRDLRNSDRMDVLVAAAVRQGFTVSQSKRAGWKFRRGGITVTCKQTPRSAMQWLAILRPLRAVGLNFPEE